MINRVFMVLFLAFALAAPVAAQQTIFLVRHAERADSSPGTSPTMAADPDLSEAGRARAEHLAEALKDAKITAIFATEFKRTQQTAAPLAKALGVTVKIVTSKSEANLIADLKAAKGNVLVVGHSNTVPEIIKRLGVTTAVAIGDDDFDNLFVVSTGTRPSLVRLHYR
jgi:2,3-bisphosphoglycerate-dependent phosphoglycerate mutase